MASRAASPPDWQEWPIERKQALRDRLLELVYEPWEQVARPEQLPPKQEWQVWLVRGGRGGGKTRTGAEWLAAELADDGAGDASAIVAPTFGEARDKCVEGVSGLLPALKRRGIGVRTWNRSLGELWLTSGARVLIDEAFSGAVKVEGENLKRCWCDELRNWRPRWGEQAWDQAIRFAVRMGKAQIVVTTTLKPTRLVKRVVREEADVVTHMRTEDNLSNLSDAFVQAVVERYRGTRLGRQELAGELLEDIEGTLWQMAWIDDQRAESDPYAGYQAISIGLDPAGGGAASEQAICVAGFGMDNRFYVLHTETHRGSQLAWLTRALELARQHGGKLVLEKNYGGQPLAELLDRVQRDTGIHAPVRIVHASDGKRVRAHPIAMLYEQGKVCHLGYHPELEEAMTSFTGQEVVPGLDLLDACVWALTDLIGYGGGPLPEDAVHRYTDEPAPGVHRWS
jgi:phage terminase large subunit-like protein